MPNLEKEVSTLVGHTETVLFRWNKQRNICNINKFYLQGLGPVVGNLDSFIQRIKLARSYGFWLDNILRMGIYPLDKITHATYNRALAFTINNFGSWSKPSVILPQSNIVMDAIKTYFEIFKVMRRELSREIWLIFFFLPQKSYVYWKHEEVLTTSESSWEVLYKIVNDNDFRQLINNYSRKWR